MERGAVALCDSVEQGKNTSTSFPSLSLSLSLSLSRSAFLFLLALSFSLPFISTSYRITVRWGEDNEVVHPELQTLPSPESAGL